MLITKQQLALIITSAVLLVFFAFRVAYHPISDNDRSRLIGIISVARYSKLEASDASYIKTGDRVEYDGKIFSFSKLTILLFVMESSNVVWLKRRIQISFFLSIRCKYFTLIQVDLLI